MQRLNRSLIHSFIIAFVHHTFILSFFQSFVHWLDSVRPQVSQSVHQSIVHAHVYCVCSPSLCKSSLDSNVMATYVCVTHGYELLHILCFFRVSRVSSSLFEKLVASVDARLLLSSIIHLPLVHSKEPPVILFPRLAATPQYYDTRSSCSSNDGGKDTV